MTICFQADADLNEIILPATVRRDSAIAYTVVGVHKATISWEFSDHIGMAQDLDARIYFAHPYAFWERGVNENTDGLLRQYFPKDRDLTLVGDHQLAEVMDTLNHRSRKTLAYRTPHEVVGIL